MNFLKRVLVNLLAMLTAAMLFGVVVILFLGVLAAAFSSKGGPTIQSQSILVVDLSVPIVDTPPASGFSAALERAFGGGGPTPLHLRAAVDGIRAAADDRRIAALFLDGSTLAMDGTSLASMRELRAALEYFRSQGKQVVGYGVMPTQGMYYLLSSANQIYLNPYGLMEVGGLGGERYYLADAFEKWGIDVQVFKVGKYKSAIETYTRNSMSAEDREQREVLYRSLWADWQADIAARRGVEVGLFDQLANSEPVLKPVRAKDLKLVDELAYFDGVLDRLKELGEWDASEKTVRQVSLAEYVRASAPVIPASDLKGRQKVAVVYAEGVIVDGEGARDEAGGNRIARALRQARLDPDIRAVVLRVNSPGGSALASDIMLQEVRRLKESGKPIIVSMGGLAASGGYFISAEADYIFAEPATITGSIGIFGIIPNVQKIADRIGITFDEVGTHRFSTSPSLTRPMRDDEIAIFDECIRDGYARFKERVARGRRLTDERVEEIAQGRVWSGRAALEIGLVDKLGGLQDAIQYAAQAAKVENWLLQEFPESKRPPVDFSEILDDEATAQIRQDPVTRLGLRLQRELRELQSLNDPRGLYYLSPYRVDFR